MSLPGIHTHDYGLTFAAVLESLLDDTLWEILLLGRIIQTLECSISYTIS
jgi:hypothetical protein